MERESQGTGRAGGSGQRCLGNVFEFGFQGPVSQPLSVRKTYMMIGEAEEKKICCIFVIYMLSSTMKKLHIYSWVQGQHCLPLSLHSWAQQSSFACLP